MENQGSTAGIAFELGVRTLIQSQDWIGYVNDGVIDKPTWKLLRQSTLWTKGQALQVGAALSKCISASFAHAGLPPVAVPAEYVAMLITRIVRPCNQLVAAYNAPKTFAARSALGQDSEYVLEDTPHWRMIALVMHYAAIEFDADLPKLEEGIEEAHRQQTKQSKKLQGKADL